MNRFTYALSAIAVMSSMTILLRALPFMIFGGDRKTPAYISFLGRVLPEAAIAMLVVYCLKDVQFASFGQPHYYAIEIICVLFVVLIQKWKHNSLISILSGTILYMLISNLI